jgi:hypothetical protein
MNNSNKLISKMIVDVIFSEGISFHVKDSFAAHSLTMCPHLLPLDTLSSWLFTTPPQPFVLKVEECFNKALIFVVALVVVVRMIDASEPTSAMALVSVLGFGGDASWVSSGGRNHNMYFGG